MLASGDIPEIIFGIVSPSQEALYGAQGCSCRSMT